MGVLPGTGNLVDVELEDAIGQLEAYRLVTDLGIVQVQLKRLIELAHCNHQFAVPFEHLLKIFGIHSPTV